MTDNHRNKLLKRLDCDTSFTLKINDGIRRDTKLKILELVDKRVFNKFTQEDLAKLCGVSLPTIKRFENLEVDSLSLFINYKLLLEDLPNKKKIEEYLNATVLVLEINYGNRKKSPT